MNFKILTGAFLAFAIASCSPSGHETENHNETQEAKFQYTVYSNDFELFAEADAFIMGVTANVLAHFSTLPDFKAVETGKITIILSVNGTESEQTLEKPTRKGIYSFNIKPETVGEGFLRFEINTGKGDFEVAAPGITVFASHDEALAAAERVVVPRTNTTVFTKEQSWKIDFSTDFPKTGPFGQVIKTTALVQSSQGNEMIVSAKTNGTVAITANNLLEGRDVSAGQALFSILGNDLADNNFSVKYIEAKSNYEKANADYERAKKLSNDKIVSEKDLLAAKNYYDNAKAVYDNLNNNFNASGQRVTSPVSGFVKQVFVKNGSYIEAGQPVVTISQNNTLILSADLPQKYVPVLANIHSANIRDMNGHQVYTFEQLNGKVLSYGKAANYDNFLIPVYIQIDNKGAFTAGSFVEIYLKTLTNLNALTVPNTALLEEQGNFYVWVQVTPELFEKREVSTGNTDYVSTEIVKGITADERIVTRGAMLIKLAQATGTLDAHSGHVH